jgi:hypothetical protein
MNSHNMDLGIIVQNESDNKEQPQECSFQLGLCLLPAIWF